MTPTLPDENAQDMAAADKLIDKNIIQHFPAKQGEAEQILDSEIKETAQKENENKMLNEVLKNSMPAIEAELKNRASALTKQEFEIEKASLKRENEVLLGEIAKLKDEFSTLREILLRAKAQGRATIPTEKDVKDAEFQRIYGDILK